MDRCRLFENAHQCQLTMKITWISHIVFSAFISDKLMGPLKCNTEKDKHVRLNFRTAGEVLRISYCVHFKWM